MKIKKATKKDLKEIAEIMINVYSKPPFIEMESLKNVLKSLNFYHKNAEIYFSEESGKTSGVIVFQIEQWWEGPVVIIQDLAVDEKYRKKGVGKSLMKFIEKYARDKKIRKIEFGTNKKSSAVEFYKKLGYKIKKNRVSMSKKLK